MFRRSLTLVDDSVAVELGRDDSYQLYLTASYRKTGTRKIQSVPFAIRELFSEVFGTTTSVVTSHTLLSANRIVSHVPNGNLRVWMDDLAQSIRKYLCNCLGLKPGKKMCKHRIYLYLVIVPTEPSIGVSIKYPVCAITGSAIGVICSRRFSKLSRDNFDKFLMSIGFRTEAGVFLPPLKIQEDKFGTLGASTPEDCTTADLQQTSKFKKGGC